MRHHSLVKVRSRTKPREKGDGAEGVDWSRGTRVPQDAGRGARSEPHLPTHFEARFARPVSILHDPPGGESRAGQSRMAAQVLVSPVSRLSRFRPLPLKDWPRYAPRTGQATGKGAIDDRDQAAHCG